MKVEFATNTLVGISFVTIEEFIPIPLSKLFVNAFKVQKVSKIHSDGAIPMNPYNALIDVSGSPVQE